MAPRYEQTSTFLRGSASTATATAPEETTNGAAEQPAAPAVAAPPAPAVPAGSLIRQGTIFDGTYHGDGDLTVEGEVRGNIDCKGSLVIREGAVVEATVAASVVQAAGRLTGDVVCSERFEAAPSAQVSGHITTPRLIIQEGARCDGQITMSGRS